jgi:hypothetical protein
MRWTRTAAVACVFTVLSGPAGASDAVTLPIRIVNNHVYAQILANGQPFVFLFDASGRSVLAPVVARSLGVSVESEMAANDGTKAGYATLDRLAIGSATITRQKFIVLPLDAFANVEGVDVPGMIGSDVLRRFVVRIDYGEKTLALIDPRSFRAKDAGTPVPFVFEGEIPQVQGTFEGVPETFDIDIGARFEAMLSYSFAKTNDLKAGHSKGVEALDGWSLGGPLRTYVMRASELTLGSVRVKGVVTGLSMLEEDEPATRVDKPGIIGGGLLKRFIVTFDYTRRMLYLKPLLRPDADAGTFDRAGMWLNRVAVGFQVASVTLKGPAELAGLKMDDVISAVDGKPATGIALDDLRRRLRNDPPGTAVTFTIKRGDKTRNATVILKDQI